MRSTWLPIGIALLFPATAVLGACGPSTDTTTSTGGGGSTTTTGGGGTGGATGGATTGGGGIGGTGGTGGTTGGTGGTGGFMPPANDACPGESVALAIGASKSITGTLNGALDNYTTFCADTDPEGGAPDVVYQLDVPAASTVTMKTTAASFVPALSLRKQDCTQRIGGDACINLGAGGGEIKVALDAGTYWVVIDSADGNTGDFTFDVTFAAPACGDGVVNPGETCDPATIVGDDGCINPDKDNGCHFGEAPPDPAIVACPGGLVTIVKNDPIQLGPYSNGSGDHQQTNPVNATTCTSPSSGPENVFHLAPKADGMLTVQIGHKEDGTTPFCQGIPIGDCADFFMYLRKGSCSSVAAADDLGCADNDNPSDPANANEVLVITSPVTKDTDYWLFVDGLDDTYGIGSYYLQLTLE